MGKGFLEVVCCISALWHSQAVKAVNRVRLPTCMGKSLGEVVCGVLALRHISHIDEVLRLHAQAGVAPRRTVVDHLAAISTIPPSAPGNRCRSPEIATFET